MRKPTPLPYENASTGKAALAGMQKLLQQFGASSFGCMEDFDAGEVGEHDEPEVRLVVERPEDLLDVAGADADLGLVVALPGRPVQDLAESRLQSARQPSVHG